MKGFRIVAFFLGALAPCVSRAQTAPPPAQQAKPADDNAFPEEQSKQAAQAAAPEDKGKPAAAAPGGDNPFPEADSEAAQKAANAGDASADAGPADDGADRTEPASSSRSRLKGVDLLGDRDDRTGNGAGGTVNNPDLAKEDVRVGQLYMADENYPGAYARFKEATVVGPGNSDAVFFLAEAARKTAHLDEAAANYKLYLDAEPKGKHSKDAKKALVDLAGK